MGMSPSERKAFAGTDADPSDRETLAPQDRDAFAQLATHGKLRGQNVELRFVPIHDLQRHRLTTFFCSPVFCVQDQPIIYGYRAFQGIGPRELPFVDRSILAHAVKFARRLAGAGTVAAIGTSVNFETLAWEKGRELYQRALRAAGVADYPFLVLNIENIPEGTQPTRLGEIIAAVRPYVKRIFVHLPDAETSLQHCGHLGVAGLTLSLPPRPTRVVAMGMAKALLRECEAQGAHSCIDHVDDNATLELMTLAGVRFGAGSAFGDREFHGDADPADVEAYMAEASRSSESESHADENDSDQGELAHP
jgi:hypothetical protein